MAADGGKKGKKQKKKKKKGKSPKSQARLGPFPTALGGQWACMPVSGTSGSLSDAWGSYSESLVRWAGCAAYMQEAQVKASLAWLDACQSALELDTEVLKACIRRYDEGWLRAQAESARQHAEAAATAVSSYAGVMYGAQSRLLEEIGRQWGCILDA